jgi:hypothetical protein
MESDSAGRRATEIGENLLSLPLRLSSETVTSRVSLCRVSVSELVSVGPLSGGLRVSVSDGLCRVSVWDWVRLSRGRVSTTTVSSVDFVF